MQSDYERIRDLAAEIEPRLLELRRDFHRHPEISWEEHRTTSKIREQLCEDGIEILDLDLETGVVARIVGGPGPTVALRADIDALPLQERTGLPFASVNHGVMHACGHDSHITWLLGAAGILARMKDRVPGEVRLLFQPGEERTGGALKLIEAGFLDGVGMIFGAHCKPDLRAGTVGISPGYLMAAVAGFTITVTGQGGHGAMPHRAVDPIPAVGAILTNLQSIVARNVDPLASGVISVGTVTTGTAGNIIPAEATISGTMRAYAPDVQELLIGRLRRIAQHTAAVLDCEAELEGMLFRVPPVQNDERAAAVAREAAEAVLGSGAVLEAIPVLASEDFAYYQRETSGCFLWIGVGNEEKGINNNWHHPEFTVDEECLPVGASVLASAALKSLHHLG